MPTDRPPDVVQRVLKAMEKEGQRKKAKADRLLQALQQKARERQPAPEAGEDQGGTS